VRRETIPRHTLTGIELSARIVSAEEYEQENQGLVCVADDVVRMLPDGLTVKTQAKRGPRTRVIPGLGIAPWLQRTMGLRIRGPWACASLISRSVQTVPATSIFAGRPARTAAS
jgi:hypothetical protein